MFMPQPSNTASVPFTGTIDQAIDKIVGEWTVREHYSADDGLSYIYKRAFMLGDEKRINSVLAVIPFPSEANIDMVDDVLLGGRIGTLNRIMQYVCDTYDGSILSEMLVKDLRQKMAEVNKFRPLPILWNVRTSPTEAKIRDREDGKLRALNDEEWDVQFYILSRFATAGGVRLWMWMPSDEDESDGVLITPDKQGRYTHRVVFPAIYDYYQQHPAIVLTDRLWYDGIHINKVEPELQLNTRYEIFGGDEGEDEEDEGEQD